VLGDLARVTQALHTLALEEHSLQAEDQRRRDELNVLKQDASVALIEEVTDPQQLQEH